ncbi:MAG: flavodoxin [Prolixibacteraceae bacterium]
MNKIALIYGPQGGSTEKVAQLISEEIGEEKIELIPVKELTKEKFESYKKVICGVATIGDDTWDQTFRKDDWSEFFPSILDSDLKHQKIACYGLGDHVTYAAHFVDGLGKLVRLLRDKGATMIGRVPIDEYNYIHSEVIEEGHFIGLPLDEDFESEKTPERVKRWVRQISLEFN